jgi:membrane fusion protein (multidrug efflux system)
MSTPTLDADVDLTEKKPVVAPVRTPARKLQHSLQKFKKPAIIAAVIVILIVVLFYAHDSFTHEETDDAYVTGHLHNISARINEAVTEVLVNDNQLVHKGDVLVAVHAISPESLDATRSTRDVNLAELKLAELQISYTTIYAPADGIVGRKNVEVGNRVTAGQTLMVIVEPDVWIVANFKETQLARMKKGQPVKITIDEVPDKVFDGKVDSFSPASGNEFALLPADNSTGNFTKIVQRVPVKVVFNSDSIKGYEDRIRAGLSAVVKVALTDVPAK